ncbi:hypothetical protein V6Z11_D13G157600 [Gossypium hirsutum]
MGERREGERGIRPGGPVTGWPPEARRRRPPRAVAGKGGHGRQWHGGVRRKWASGQVGGRWLGLVGLGFLNAELSLDLQLFPSFSS